MVIGAGFMGSGIAQVCIQSGYKVILCDTEIKSLKKAKAGIAWSLEKLHQKGRIKEPPASVLERLETAQGFETGLETDPKISWVIEAVVEDESLKKKILAMVEDRVEKEIKIATNTSSIPVSRLALSLKHPERFMGLHFFGPVPLMGLVEVVRGKMTSEAVFAQGMAFVKNLGKYPVKVTKDIPGFVMNRVFAAAFRECQELVANGITTPRDIDTGMRLGYGWTAGPFEIADNAGLDTIVRIGKSMKSLGESYLYSDTGLVEKMVEKGNLGRKSGQGFYPYGTESGKTSK